MANPIDSRWPMIHTIFKKRIHQLSSDCCAKVVIPIDATYKITIVRTDICGLINSLDINNHVFISDEMIEDEEVLQISKAAESVIKNRSRKKTARYSFYFSDYTEQKICHSVFGKLLLVKAESSDNGRAISIDF